MQGPIERRSTAPLPLGEKRTLDTVKKDTSLNEALKQGTTPLADERLALPARKAVLGQPVDTKTAIGNALDALGNIDIWPFDDAPPNHANEEADARLFNTMDDSNDG